MNVLPSAPPQLYPMQELTQLNAEDFRLKKINDLLKELSDEVEHYRQVAKKYKRSHSMVHTSAVGLGTLSVGLSSGALATALTGFGIVASPALAGVATICGLGSVGFAAASKRLERKVTKHEKIYTLAQAKRNSVNELTTSVGGFFLPTVAHFHVLSWDLNDEKTMPWWYMMIRNHHDDVTYLTYHCILEQDSTWFYFKSFPSPGGVRNVTTGDARSNYGDVSWRTCKP